MEKQGLRCIHLLTQAVRQQHVLSAYCMLGIPLSES